MQRHAFVAWRHHILLKINHLHGMRIFFGERHLTIISNVLHSHAHARAKHKIFNHLFIQMSQNINFALQNDMRVQRTQHPIRKVSCWRGRRTRRSNWTKIKPIAISLILVDEFCPHVYLIMKIAMYRMIKVQVLIIVLSCHVAFDLNNFDALNKHIYWKLLNAKLLTDNHILSSQLHIYYCLAN